MPLSPAFGQTRAPVRGKRHVIRGKPWWPANHVMVAAVVALIGMQLSLPSRLVLHPWWLLLALEAGLLISLVADPRRLDRQSPLRRTAILVQTAVIILTNAWWALCVVGGLTRGSQSEPGSALLATGAVIWTTNVIVFALWYWELERNRSYPDFLFTQMENLTLAPPDWEPAFSDYLYLSFTNATAFSPTDVRPLSRWAKLTMMFQSAVSLCIIVLIIARAVNGLT